MEQKLVRRLTDMIDYMDEYDDKFDYTGMKKERERNKGNIGTRYSKILKDNLEVYYKNVSITGRGKKRVFTCTELIKHPIKKQTSYKGRAILPSTIEMEKLIMQSVYHKDMHLGCESKLGWLDAIGYSVNNRLTKAYRELHYGNGTANIIEKDGITLNAGLNAEIIDKEISNGRNYLNSALNQLQKKRFINVVHTYGFKTLNDSIQESVLVPRSDDDDSFYLSIPADIDARINHEKEQLFTKYDTNEASIFLHPYADKNKKFNEDLKQWLRKYYIADVYPKLLIQALANRKRVINYFAKVDNVAPETMRQYLFSQEYNKNKDKKSEHEYGFGDKKVMARFLQPIDRALYMGTYVDEVKVGTDYYFISDFGFRKAGKREINKLMEKVEQFEKDVNDEEIAENGVPSF